MSTHLVDDLDVLEESLEVLETFGGSRQHVYSSEVGVESRLNFLLVGLNGVIYQLDL